MILALGLSEGVEDRRDYEESFGCYWMMIDPMRFKRKALKQQASLQPRISGIAMALVSELCVLRNQHLFPTFKPTSSLPTIRIVNIASASSQHPVVVQRCSLPVNVSIHPPFNLRRPTTTSFSIIHIDFHCLSRSYPPICRLISKSIGLTRRDPS
ncbi:hypothetical protein BT96DRAFT_987464 [Gymnopus androsaceus JB14]|uniref:Uncharacterized protein n=1 Tax=Gymnopus androsaceus JB14 TaxID=1447944 RepID=A0A6A4I9W0_9AGAR|nr:hypothetical protein BT96DRAFT_987464 [Gymnopus androsaceus JB14]